MTYFTVSSQLLPGGIKENHRKNPGRIASSQAKNLEPGSPKYEAGVLTIHHDICFQNGCKETRSVGDVN
jgi:hypothetical protein